MNPTEIRRKPKDNSTVIAVKSYPKFKSPSALPRHMESEVISEKASTNPHHKHQSNSTSSLYIKDTLGAPDIDALVRCISVALEYHIAEGHEQSENTNKYEIFDERRHPIMRDPTDTMNPPVANEIYEFLIVIFKAERLGAECGILCLAYIERMISVAHLLVNASNWRRVTLSALILASKVWEDQAVWNVDFMSIFDCVTAQDLGQLEKLILNLLQFNVSLKAALYAKYYFELRSLAESADISFPLQPLSKEDSDKLETKSKETEQSVRKNSDKYKLVRSNSETSLNSHKSPRVVLN
eukprot:TRINITY_DN5170_c0_g1_i1.p1 TRINITY_DN5170_c0_g1~~TRINITY_DN5170_c0_g1_i1.p1  ORF type:complete len:310 (-),score=107.07 TRINITY_DN5170_c0_g1_i1:76-966(-)